MAIFGISAELCALFRHFQQKLGPTCTSFGVLHVDANAMLARWNFRLLQLDAIRMQ